MQKIRHIMRKEFLQVFRTREMVAIIFVAPIIQMAVLGFAITNEVKHIRLLIADRDNSRVSREVVRAFEHSDRFQVIGFQRDMQQVAADIHAWEAQMAVVIPEHFGRDLRRGLQPDVQLIVDGLDGNTAGVALGYAQGILSDLARRMGNPALQAAFARRTHSVEMQERMWYNLDLYSAQYMVPGIVVVLLTIISMMLSSMSLVREREIGTLEQLMVTPLRKQELLAGKLLPFLILAMVELGIVLQLAQVIFSIHMQGSYLLLGGLAILFLFTTLGLGTLVSTITSTQQQAMFVSWFFMVFMLLMSGLFIPIENMPHVLQLITYLNPMRYFMSIMRDIFQKGSTFEHLIVDIVPMTVLGIIIFVSSVLKFRKRIS